MAKSKIICEVCGSDDIVVDAWASWDVEKQEWVLHSTYDSRFCQECEEERDTKSVDIEPS